MYVRTGLSSYAKSLELLACNGGIDCSWEVAYSANFLTETKLTADFESLRQLEKPAITRDMLQVISAGSLAKRAEELLNDKLMREFMTSMEKRESGEQYLAYLLQKIVAQTLDDFAFKLDAKPRLTSSLVNALSKQAPSYVSTWDLIERVKLLNCALSRQKLEDLRVKMTPDLFNLTMITILQEKTGQDQKRLLVDQLFTMIKFFDDSESSVLCHAVESGAWGRIAESHLFKSTIEKIAARDCISELSIISVLLVDLNLLIQKINRQAASFVQGKEQPEAPVYPAEKAISKVGKVMKVLEGTDLSHRLVEQCLDDENHREAFMKEFKVAVMDENIAELEARTLAFGFPDGVSLQLSIDTEEEKKDVDLRSYSFELRYQGADDGQPTNRTLFHGDEVEPIEIKQRSVKISCAAKKIGSNLQAIDDEDAIIRGINDSNIKYVLHSSCRQYLYFVSDKAVHRLKKHS